MVALNESVPLDAWTKIVEKAVADAIGGDWWAREWLGRHVIGEKPAALVDLVASEVISENAVEDEIDHRARYFRDQAIRQKLGIW